MTMLVITMLEDMVGDRKAVQVDGGTRKSSSSTDLEIELTTRLNDACKREFLNWSNEKGTGILKEKGDS